MVTCFGSRGTRVRSCTSPIIDLRGDPRDHIIPWISSCDRSDHIQPRLYVIYLIISNHLCIWSIWSHPTISCLHVLYLITSNHLLSSCALSDHIQPSLHVIYLITSNHLFMWSIWSYQPSLLGPLTGFLSSQSVSNLQKDIWCAMWRDALEIQFQANGNINVDQPHSVGRPTGAGSPLLKWWPPALIRYIGATI